MTVSLMSLLGGNVALTANGGNAAAADAQGSASATAAFESVMADSEQHMISAEELRAFFKAHGAAVPAALNNGQPQSAEAVLKQLMVMQDNNKLPANMMMALQEVMGAADDMLTADAAAFDGLPQRELTPEELSELVQETGLPPVVILAALQDTPAASPNLAANMGGDVTLDGVKFAGEAAQTAQQQADIAKSIADMMQKGLTRKEATELSSQLASVDFTAMNMSKEGVLNRIAAVLRGEKLQGEFDLSAKNANQNVVQLPVAASATAKAQVETQPSVAADMLAKTQTKQVDDAAMAQQALNGAGGKASAQGQMQAQAQAQGDGLLQQNGQSAQNAQQAPATDSAAANQNSNFAATLESSSSLRNLNQVTPMDAQLRHSPAQTENPAEQVKVHIQNALADGTRRMEIQLKPHELGRVDVRIDTDADGKSHVTVTADKRDTLEMLQRDARSLERALADAGLKADSNSLSFNLRGDEGQQQAKNEQKGKNPQATFDLNGDHADDIDSKLDTSEMALTYDAGRAYRLSLDWGLDISV